MVGEKEVKVCYTVCGWVDMKIPKGLTSQQTEEFAFQQINEKLNDNELFDGMKQVGVWPNEINEDQIEVEYVEETIEKEEDTDYVMLYAKDKYKI